MKTVKKILSDLNEIANPEYIEKMEYFGIVSTEALGIKNAILKPYAKNIGRNQLLAEELWDVKIHEAKLLSISLCEPKKLTAKKAEQWVSEIYSWDICDGLGMKVFPKTTFGLKKAIEWTTREPEFEKRVGFATMVGIVLDRKVPDETIEAFFPIMEREAWDERNFVKKAINWTLRQAGKRNLSLNKKAIACAERVLAQDTKAARWIANDALRELKSDLIQERLMKKGKKRAD
ncbi:MAG: DNA alkylation repair protein [Cyclobacteriaceae bacterium]